MGSVDVMAARLARPQDGLVRSGDLVAAGIAASTISRRVADGTWSRPVQGVVDTTGARWTWDRRVRVAVLAGPPATVASHTTAARLHGIAGFDAQSRIEVTTPRRHRTRDVPWTVHSTIHPDRQPATVREIAVTGPVRTMVGVCAGPTPDRLVHRGLRDLLRRGLASVEALTAHSLAGLPGSARLARAVETEWEHALHRVDSMLEDAWCEALAGWPLPRWVTQHQVNVEGRVYRLDVAWPSHRIALEIDGETVHADALAAAADAAREAALVRAGWSVVRVRAVDLRPDRRPAVRIRLEAMLAAATQTMSG